MEKNQPAAKFKAGAITATVWKNESQRDGKVSEYHTVNLGRSYKDRSGAWQTTSSLRVSDIPRATLVLQEAFRHLVLTEKNQEVVV